MLLLLEFELLKEIFTFNLFVKLADFLQLLKLGLLRPKKFKKPLN